MYRAKCINKRILFLFFFCNTLFLSAADFPFIKNKGQLPQNVVAKVNLPGGSLFVEKGVLTYHFFDQKKLNAIHELKTQDRIIPTHAFQVIFNHHIQNISTTLIKESNYFENYFIGNNAENWVSEVHTYQVLLEQNIYPGIDLKMYRKGENLKYDFLVEPNANTELIEMHYKGIEHIFIKDEHLFVQTTVNSITELKPEAYQIIDGKRINIPCRFVLKGETVRFEFPQGYQKEAPLIIDPTLIFSTYSGSVANNFGYTATYDNLGFLYAGSTAFGVGYPTTLGAYQVNFGGGTGGQGTDIAITKYDTTGTTAIYSTYLGGDMDELPHSLIVNSANELFIFGTSGSADYPVTQNAYQSAFLGGPSFIPSGIGISYPNGCDIIVSRLSANGGNLLASTYLGGTENDGLNIAAKLKFNYADEVRGEIDIDKNNNVYIATCTRSADFPIVGNVAQPILDSLQEGVVVKIDNQLSHVIWSTFLGGSSTDAIYSLALDNKDNIYVTGGTISDDFPTTSAALHPNYLDSLQPDAFVTYLKNDGTQILASTYFGSNQYDQAYFVEIDKTGNVYLLGQTKATGNTLIYQASYSIPGGGEFIAKLSKQLDILLQSTVIGANTGKPNISPTAFLVDVCNKIYVAGWGSSIGIGNAGTTFNLPITSNAFQSSTDGNDFYLLVLDNNMSNLVYATYFGGNQATEHVDGGTSRLDKKGIVYQCVCAGCGGFSDFPTTQGALSATNNAASGSQCNSAVFKFNFNFPMTVADFTAPWVGCNLLVNFQNLTTFPQNTQFQWDFGDGTSSTLPNPSHLYGQAGIYNITLIANNPFSCNQMDTITKQVFILSGSSQVLDSVEICKNESVQIGLLPVNDSTISYFWFPSYGLSNVAVSNPFVNTDSTILYQLIISNGTCTDTLFQQVVVNAIQVEAGTDTTICNDPILLSAISNPFISAFLWSSNNIFSDTLSMDSSLLVTIPQSYFVQVTDGRCIAIDSVLLKPQDIEISLTGTFSVCQGDSAIVKVNNLLPLIPLIQYQWNQNADYFFSSDSSMIWFFPDSSTWVVVEVQNQDGCLLKDSIWIEVNKFPIIDSLWASKNPIYKGESTTIFVQTDFRIRWGNGDTNALLYATPITDSLFVVEVFSTSECSITDSIFIQLLTVFCEEEKILIPTAFTPNNQPPNNTYRIVDSDGIITHFKLEIFNRFGQKVFSSTDKNGAWDGTYGGDLLVPQVFDFYLEIECIGGEKLFKKGNITLIR